MEAESENSSSDSDDESNTNERQVKTISNDKQTKTTEEPISKRHKPVNESQEQNGVVKQVSNIQTVPPHSLTMDQYAALKCDLRQRKLYLTVGLFMNLKHRYC